MKRTFKEYKAAARAAMKGSYGVLLLTIIIAAFVPNAIIQILSYFMRTDHVSVLISMLAVEVLISIILMRPLIVGLCRVFLHNARGKTDINEMLHPFRSNLTNVVKVCFIRDLRLILWAIIPCVIGWFAVAFAGSFIVAKFYTNVDELYTSLQEIAIYINTNGETGLSQNNMEILAVFMSVFVGSMLIFCIPAIIKSYEYKMIDFILAENENISSREAFRTTREMMKGNKLRLFGLEMSFIGWILLGLLTFSIALIFVLPYIQAAVTQFYLDVSGQNSEKDFSYESD